MMLFEKPVVEKQPTKGQGKCCLKRRRKRRGRSPTTGEDREIFDAVHLNPKNNHLPKLLAR
jgi:nucleoid DNA-binding protein